MIDRRRYAILGQRALSALVWLGLVAWCVAPAAAATEYTLTVEALTPGRVAALRFGHEVSNSAAGIATHGELYVTKSVDQSSPLLLDALCKTQHLARVRVEAIDLTPTEVRYYALRLEDVLVTALAQTSISGDATPVEQVSFNYQRIEWTAIVTDPAGLPAYALSTGFDQGDGTSGPRDPDSDEDGIPDSYEVSESLKVLIHDADEDRDGDRMSNLKEYLSGTSADDPTSVFRFTGILHSASGVGSPCTVTFSSVPGRTYDLYGAGSLTDVPALLQTVVATGTETSVDLTVPSGQAFVRVSVRVP